MRVRILFLFLLISFCSCSFGQNVSDSLLATFYNKTLSISFLNKIENESNNSILIKTEFDKSLLIQQNNLNQFIFFDKKTSYHSVLTKPFKKNAGKVIYWIGHKWLGTDTVDINIVSEKIISMSRKRITLAVDFCDSVAMGYIPNARFIFDRAKKEWNLMTAEEIREQKRAELQQTFNSNR